MRFLPQTAASVTFTTTVVFGIAVSASAATLVSTTSVNTTVSNRNTVSAELEKKLQTALDNTLKTSGTIGATVGIISPQGTWFGASGVSSLETGIPMGTEDKFPIGSTTKPFTAVTILKLAEEGKLSLEDTLDKWLPDSVISNVPDSKSITIRQLLNGKSGIYDFLQAPLIEDIASNPTKQWTPFELVSYAYGKPRFSSELIEKFRCTPNWCYPNTGMVLAGIIVEKATGSTYADVLRSRILNPLGMNNTFFVPQSENGGGYVNGYQYVDNNVTPYNVTGFNLSYASTAGGIVSNTQDVTRFATGLFGGELLSSSSQRQMLDFNNVGFGDNFKYGLGLASSEFEGIGKAWGHPGDVVGYGSQWWYFPELGITYANLQNSQPQSDIRTAIMATLLKKKSKRVLEPNVFGGLIAMGGGILLCRIRKSANLKSCDLPQNAGFRL
jgi:D-alanyl-D-alanine carboxypeptidase